jgi:hypothetical protein
MAVDFYTGNTVDLMFIYPFIVIKSYKNNQQDATVQENLLFQCFLISQHVSSDTLLTIRSSKRVIAASGFTYCNKELYFSIILYIVSIVDIV